MSYNCYICNKNFSTKGTYTRHINNKDIHIKYKPFFEGEIKNLHFIPEYADFEQLTNIYNQE